MSYRLVIHNDTDHTFEYVIALLVPVLRIQRSAAAELASAIDEDGSAAIPFADLARAREVEERILSGGRDHRMGSRSDGSLIVSIEEGEGETLRIISRGRVGPRGYEPLTSADVKRFQDESESRAAAANPFDPRTNGTAFTVADSLGLLSMALFLVLIAVLAVLAAR